MRSMVIIGGNLADSSLAPLAAIKCIGKLINDAIVHLNILSNPCFPNLSFDPLGCSVQQDPISTPLLLEPHSIQKP